MNTSFHLMTSALAATGIYWVVSHFTRGRRETASADASLRTASPDEVRFLSRDGRARVSASLLSAERANAAVVLVVGQVGCWGSDSRVSGRSLHVRTMAQALRARGITVLVTRLRGHGEAEHHDVLGAIDYLIERGYRAGSIGVLGASVGAAAALLAAAEEPAVHAVVADSPRVDVLGAARRAAAPLPGSMVWVLPLARWLGRTLSGVNLGRRPLLGSPAALRDRAVLIIHGRGDRLVPPSVAQCVAKATGARLWLTASHSHAGTLHEALPLYITRVVDFFCQHLLPQPVEPMMVPEALQRGLAPVWKSATL
ncbi:MAG: prolyl oligopeptidase family serine peptidase [Rhizobacter sp.]